MTDDEMRAKVKCWYANTAPEERAKHFELQKRNMVKSEVTWGDEGTRMMTEGFGGH